MIGERNFRLRELLRTVGRYISRARIGGDAMARAEGRRRLHCLHAAGAARGGFATNSRRLAVPDHDAAVDDRPIERLEPGEEVVVLRAREVARQRLVEMAGIDESRQAERSITVPAVGGSSAVGPTWRTMPFSA